MGSSKGFSRKNPDQAVPSISLKANRQEEGIGGVWGDVHGSLFPNSLLPEKGVIMLTHSKPRVSSKSKGPVGEIRSPLAAASLSQSPHLLLQNHSDQTGFPERQLGEWDAPKQSCGEGSEKAARQPCCKTSSHSVTSRGKHSVILIELKTSRAGTRGRRVRHHLQWKI